MARLSLWLPPFSPDYSGATAVLFDLNTITAMHDASGCTGNYTGYDEPRWYGSKSGVFCSGLRQIDAVLGDDEKLIKKMIAAAKDIKPDLMALIGSPVPMVIGADLEGIAVELEDRTGLPCFGFSTTGTSYYDKGAFMAAKALIDRFTEKREAIAGRVNILGAIPMDFGYGEEIKNVKQILTDHGYEIGLTLAMDYTLDDLKAAASAKVNLAISRFGYQTAVHMEKKFGTPYLCGFPAGEKGLETWLDALKRVEETGVSEVLNGEGTINPEADGVLIIGEQVMSNAIRNALEREYGMKNITVGCLYGTEKGLKREGDFHLPNEKTIKQEMNRPEYTLIIADPFMKVLLPEDTDKEFLPFSQYAVSSKLGKDGMACLSGIEFNKWFKKKEE